MLKMESLFEFSELFVSKIIHKGIVCIWCGTNDVFYRTSGNHVFEWFASFCDTLKSVGHKVVALTILPRSNASFLPIKYAL